MEHLRTSYRAWGFALLAIGITASMATWWALRDVVVQTQTKEDHMQTLETTVTGQSGLVTIVRTPRNDGESAADWQARHQEGIDVALLL